MIADYIAEERNPENRKRVRVVEAFAPSEILSSGMCLVDTPGLGSIFQQNSETTFVPHIDAALIVLGADPPISGEEAAIAEEIGREAPHTDRSAMNGLSRRPTGSSPLSPPAHASF
jgi:hypothetical protein